MVEIKMPESSESKINPSIVAALIGLVGTIAATLITVIMTRPASPQMTAIPAATAVEFPTLSAGVAVTQRPVATSPGTVPTVKYPNGHRFKLFYDDSSFYLLNLSDATIPINRVAFERLDNDNVPLNRFNGTRWAAFFPNSTPGKCVAIQLLGGSPYLDPPECGHNNFLSLRTPPPEDPSVFWTAKETSHQFRVLWRAGGQDEEIARCEIDAGTCEVFLP